uniref:Uncharacterized protein n=1 Tax=Nelumbo nucifera TaxID=4432 RepID=A0A822YV53_NELNU|nr:TPA_asm: hypothetical protein HUJ06_011989 [Nelumbo nucifera]
MNFFPVQYGEPLITPDLQVTQILCPSPTNKKGERAEIKLAILIFRSNYFTNPNRMAEPVPN